MLSEKKQNYILEGIPKIGMFYTLSDVPIIPYMLNLVGGLSSLRPCDQGTSASSSSSKVQSLVHTNRIPLFYKKNISKDYAIRKENITIVHFLSSSCDHDMSLHGKLVAVASRWLLKLFFLESNDVLDAVLGTDLGEQRCFKFLIRQFVSLNKTKIICSMTDRKLSLSVVSVV